MYELYMCMIKTFRGESVGGWGGGSSGGRLKWGGGGSLRDLSIPKGIFPKTT